MEHAVDYRRAKMQIKRFRTAPGFAALALVVLGCASPSEWRVLIETAEYEFAISTTRSRLLGPGVYRAYARETLAPTPNDDPESRVWISTTDFDCPTGRFRVMELPLPPDLVAENERIGGQGWEKEWEPAAPGTGIRQKLDAVCAFVAKEHPTE